LTYSAWNFGFKLGFTFSESGQRLEKESFPKSFPDLQKSIFGGSWGGLGGVLGQLGDVLGVLGAALRRLREVLWASWVGLGASWKVFGASWRHVGGVWEGPRPRFRRVWG